MTPATVPPVIGARVPVGWWRWLVLALMAAAVVVLWRYEPAGQVFYPRCWMYSATGLKCAGCGVLRASHAMLRGDFRLAWSLNPLWVCYAPLLGWMALAWVGSLFGLRVPNPLVRPWFLGVIGGLAMAYGIARNIPGLGWLG